MPTWGRMMERQDLSAIVMLRSVESVTDDDRPDELYMRHACSILMSVDHVNNRCSQVPEIRVIAPVSSLRRARIMT